MLTATITRQATGWACYLATPEGTTEAAAPTAAAAVEEVARLVRETYCVDPLALWTIEARDQSGRPVRLSCSVEPREVPLSRQAE